MTALEIYREAKPAAIQLPSANCRHRRAFSEEEDNLIFVHCPQCNYSVYLTRKMYREIMKDMD